MVHTQKKYNKIGNSFVEDTNGFCIGFEWVDNFSINRRVIYINSTDDLIKKTTNTNCVFQWLDPLDGFWKKIENIEFVAHERTYINITTGRIEPNPYITQVDIIDGVEIETQILKPNLKTEFQFLYDYQFQLFHSVRKNIQAREFGATSFQ